MIQNIMTSTTSITLPVPLKEAAKRFVQENVIVGEEPRSFSALATKAIEAYLKKEQPELLPAKEEPIK